MADRKRLAVLVASLAHGGIGKMRVHLINEFIRQGVDVDLLMADADSPYLGKLDPAVRVVELPTSHAVTGVPALVRYFRRNRPDAMLTQRIRVNVAALRARWLARSRVPVYVTLNTNLSAQLDSMPAKKRARQLAKLRRYYPRNEGLIAISRGVAEDVASLLNMDAERIPVIYNPVVSEELVQKAAEPLDDPWFADDAPPVILGVGRLEPQKDFATLVRAFAHLRAERRCRLVILGEGKQRDMLSDLSAELGVGEDVRLAGFVDNPQRYMARARVFVMSSAWEGLGNALIEALAVGTPVVSTDCPSGPSEILEDGRFGALVPVGEDRAMADAIGRSMEQPPSEDLLDTAVERFTVSGNALRYLDAMGLLPPGAGGQ